MAAPPVAPPSQSVLHLLQDADDAATRGDRIGAVQRYHSAMVFAPSHPDAYNRLAQFYLTDDQPDMARKYFAIALDVDLVPVRVERAGASQPGRGRFRLGPGPARGSLTRLRTGLPRNRACRTGPQRGAGCIRRRGV